MFNFLVVVYTFFSNELCPDLVYILICFLNILGQGTHILGHTGCTTLRVPFSTKMFLNMGPFFKITKFTVLRLVHHTPIKSEYPSGYLDFKTGNTLCVPIPL